MNVELKNIHKSFGPVRANKGIKLTIPGGTIQGLLGENGAGKSTLMKILSGFFRQDQGEILLDGREVKINSPADAIRRGVGMLHQDPLDFVAMNALDNFILGQSGGIIPNRAGARQQLLELGDRFGIRIDPEAELSSMTVGERQQLEILRLLGLGVRTLILDEPTTGISAQQMDLLFATLRRLAESGKTVIFVSHKLREVERLCDSVAVLRDGELVSEAVPPYVTDELVEMMFGKIVKLGSREQVERGQPALELVDVTAETYRITLRDVSLEVHSGEVIGLAGMEGSGQQLLLRACAGLIPPVDGEIRVAGKNLAGRNYLEFRRHGVAYLPASRLEEGLISGLSLTEHFALAEVSRSAFIDWGEATQRAASQIAEFSIRGRPASPVEALSGGNQQRALLALLGTALKLLLMEHPTRGLDMESAIWVWQKLKERCALGTAIFFISADLEEIIHYSDRVLVFFGGQVSDPIDARRTSVEELGQLIGGMGFEVGHG